MSELSNKYPCLEYNLSILENETDKLVLFFSFLRARGISLSNIEALSALYASMGLLTRRYTKEDFSDLSVSSVSCDTIDVGGGSMCNSCRESVKFSNRWYDEECQLLAACFAYNGLRETLRKRYKSKVSTLFCSYVRASLLLKEDLYIPVNRFVFNDYDTIFFEWIKRVGVDSELVNDLALRAFPAINDAIKASYPGWRSANEEFLRTHITELVYRAIAIKQPVEYYVQLAAKMYEALKPAKSKKTVQVANELPSDALGSVGLLFSNDALVANYNAKQREKSRKQLLGDVEASADAVLETVENEESCDLVNVESCVQGDVFSDTKDSLEEATDEALSMTLNNVTDGCEKSVETPVTVKELREQRNKKKSLRSVFSEADAEPAGKKVAVSPPDMQGEVRNPPVPFRLSLTYSALFDQELASAVDVEPEWRKGFRECCEMYNIVYVDSPAKLESLDVTVLSNDIIACEVLKDTLGEYLIMYLPKQNLFVLLPSNMLAQTSAILTTFFGLKNMIKLTCYPLPLVNWLCREMLPCEGIYDIRTICGMVWHDKLASYHISDICDYRTFISIVSGMKSDGSRPDVVYGMPKYRVVYLEARRVLSQGSMMAILRREMAYNLLVGRSYNLLGIVENCSVPYIDYEVTHDGLGRIVYDFTHKITFLDRGCLVSGRYLSAEREEGGISRAYKEVCIKIVLSHYFSKYEPMLMQFNEKSGIVFYVSERDCADFYTLFNRYMIQCGAFYVVNEPIVSMQIENV